MIQQHFIVYFVYRIIYPMKLKNFIIYILILLNCSCNSLYYHIESLNSNVELIKKGKIESVIFSKDADCFLCNLGVSRFTPTIKEINEAEEILKKNIKSANDPMYNQGDGCPIIHKNLKNYRRQYYGYIDNMGHKILYVNFLWARHSVLDRLKGYHMDDSESWKNDRVIVLDGCSYYWSIDINITEQKLQNMSVNGSA